MGAAFDQELTEHIESTKQVVKETFETYQGEIKNLGRRLSDLEIVQQRQGLGGWHDGGESRSEFNKALRAFVKHGDMSGLQTKSMAVSSDPDGGYFVPAELSNSITSTIFQSSPIRQIARVVSIDTDAFEEILDKDQVGASWVEETGSRTETTSPEVGKLRVPVHEIYAAPRVTQKLLDDSKIDLAGWLSEKIGDKFGRSEATAFVSGDGIGKPRGFLSYTTAATSDATRTWGVLEHVASGASGAFASSNPGDKVIDLVF
ncbi:MAG: phage major capsid protein, partial [Acidimicrobiia bacterium]